MKKMQGVALITVMLVMAIVAILATQMSGRIIMQLQRTDNIQLNQQAYWYAMGAEAFSKRVLIMTQEEDEEVTNLSQQWAQGYNSFPVDYGQISGEIHDLHACLNLNALRVEQNANNPANGAPPNSANGTVKKPVARQALENLIVNLAVNGIGEFEAEYMADALTDWLDENTAIASAGGAEDNDYGAKEHPYNSANHFIASTNELRLIEHFTVPVIMALKPYVCVIPQSNTHRININTINEDHSKLLAALLDISDDEAKDILGARGDEGFETLDEFYNIPEMTGLNLTEEQKQQFVVDSEYFKLTANTNFNQSFFDLNSVLQVVAKDKVLVISRTIGRLND